MTRRFTTTSTNGLSSKSLQEGLTSANLQKSLAAQPVATKPVSAPPEKPVTPPPTSQKK